MAYDNVLKRIAAEYPFALVQWLLAVDAEDIEQEPTELNRESIRSDAVYFLPQLGQILHIEFQTEPQSNPPVPLRMLDYWVGLYRKYRCPIEQVVIFLKPTSAEVVFTEQFAVGNTVHQYRVLRIWEQDPAPLLANPGLLSCSTFKLHIFCCGREWGVGSGEWGISLIEANVSSLSLLPTPYSPLPTTTGMHKCLSAYHWQSWHEPMHLRLCYSKWLPGWI